MKSRVGWTTVILALASACGGATEGTATAGASDSASSSSTGPGNSSFPTTSASGASDSNTASGTSTSGNSDSNSNSNSDPTTQGSNSDTATTTSPGTDPTPGTSDPGTSTSTGDTTAGDTTVGVSASDTSTGSTTTDGSSSGGGESSTGGMAECGNLLDATIRDFKVEHPDFEKYSGNVAYKGLVKVDLGGDQKPVYAAPGPTPQTSGPDNFKQWYNDVPGVNQAIKVQLMLTEIMPGIFQYKSDAFFPVDNQGFGNEGFGHNFAFTTEIHTQFIYNGGEVFTFIGDDDLWMFINGKLAIDLGGLHPPDTQTVNLDAEAANLGIVKGQVYPMDIFHAERHSTGSNFRIDTTIGCFVPQ
ncbi:MAG: fibro-slime domain-containing protein [Myxococcales bacterium]|nr:fibro-slime domain-containing protein [Myxococcales bacterium]